jgi:hypothetical protein
MSRPRHKPSATKYISNNLAQLGRLTTRHSEEKVPPMTPSHRPRWWIARAAGGRFQIAVFIASTTVGSERLCAAIAQPTTVAEAAQHDDQVVPALLVRC